MRTMSLKDAVKLYGNEKQKEALGNNNGNLLKNQLESLIKTIRQHYEVVSIEGRGRKRQFICSGERDVLAPREDKRSNNSRPIPYEYELNSLILNYISKNKSKSLIKMSISTWALKLGLIEIKILKASHDKYIRESQYAIIRNQHPSKFGSEDIAMLEHFLRVEMDRIRRNIESTFNRLAKNRIIIHTIEAYGCTMDGEHVELSDYEVQQLADMKIELMKEFEVSDNDLIYKHKEENVIAYKEAKEEFLNDMGYRYTYMNHGCAIKVTEKRINTYLEGINKKNQEITCLGLSKEDVELMVQDFREEFSNYSLSLAADRQERLKTSGNYIIRQKKKYGKYLPAYELLLVFYQMTSRTDLQHEIPIDPNNPFLNLDEDVEDIWEQESV